MSEYVPEIPGQTTIDDVAADPTGTGDALSVMTDATSAAAEESPVYAQPPEHHFTLTHALHNPGENTAYKTTTTTHVGWEAVLEHVLAIGAMIGKDVPAILAAL